MAALDVGGILQGATFVLSSHVACSRSKACAPDSYAPRFLKANTPLSSASCCKHSVSTKSLIGLTSDFCQYKAYERSCLVSHTHSRRTSASRQQVVQAVLDLEKPKHQTGSNSGCESLDGLAAQFEALGDARERSRLLLQFASRVPRLEVKDRVKMNRVMGCTAQVWLKVHQDVNGRMIVSADSDSELTRGLGALLSKALSGLRAEEILALDSSALTRLASALKVAVQQPSRINGLQSMFQAVLKQTRAVVMPSSTEHFPSLLITADGTIEAQGDFAKAQAQYLQPDPRAVDELVELLESRKMGVVAHFYMDPQVQGVLAAAQQKWPHVHISDSLVMADRALKMVEAGCERLAVLGVDFMAENVRAIVAKGGFSETPVYRMSEFDIGCSLAEAAESPAYTTYLSQASCTPKSLHVIYINTSLDTKANAQALLPTITCTSSNVVQTVLQAFAQVPDLHVWYGPDTYMGGNLVDLLNRLAEQSDEEVQAIHPGHTAASIAALLPRLHYFQEGTCIVHDLFGSEVVERVRKGYNDAYLTAHFEVPGEMFALAMDARVHGMGTVGSTQTILDFILARTREALARGFDERLKFVLGTESGMITSIVNAVRKELAAARQAGSTAEVEVEVVFPVSSSAIATTNQEGIASSSLGGGAGAALSELPIVPGVQGGEGCSVSGGCASCPYMKMNTLDALVRVAKLAGSGGEPLLNAYAPRAFSHQVAGRTVADIGCDPILHMRHFQTTGNLSEELVQDILTRNS